MTEEEIQQQEAPEEEPAAEEEPTPEQEQEPEPEPEEDNNAALIASVDQKLLDAAGRLVIDAPPGEFDDCIHALSQFVSDPNVAQAAKAVYLEKWMVAHCLPVQVGDKTAMLCEEASLGNGKYVEPNSMKPFKYDFESRKAIPLDGEPIKSTTLREVIQSTIQKFSSTTLRNGCCGVYDSPNGVSIIMSGSSISKENFRTGSLLLRFTYNDGQLKGTIALQAHFYENGNAMGSQTSEYNEAVSGSDEGQIASNILKKISTMYQDWTSKMQNGFELLKSEGLNVLRRRLPKTQTKVNWRHEIIGAAAMPTGKR
ncbi:F-actin capping protein alpha subunit [Tritrichomonas foetus]|uniref:F-actin-capping protein subunit alpha n=1 Tax=Tritrichomonas foetus TaxID=1144522 RepID=A0A1J4JCZ5_9EUKA|nr:F-actin capping protein alpha subunit [Tritrichomonas foetus]|eukprot:OHS97042.1 F-actin capping protein alpha subunit [Tritrichomonas foetus]